MNWKASPILMRYGYHLLRAWVLVALLGPVLFAQTKESTLERQKNQEDLFQAIIQAEVERPEGVSDLCRVNRDLVNSTLWTWLANRAAMTNSSKYELALQAHRTALRVAQVIEDERLIARSYFALGRRLVDLNQHREAIEAFVNSSSSFSRADLVTDLIYVNAHIAHAHYSVRNFEAAVEYANRALAVWETVKGTGRNQSALPEEYGAALALNILGLVSVREARFWDAIGKLHDSLELLEGLHGIVPNQERLITDALDSLGGAYGLVGDLRWSLIYSGLALKRAQASGSRSMEARILLRLGSLYLKRADYASASDYISRGLEIATELNDVDAVSAGLLSLGIVEVQEGLFESALKRLRRCLAVADANKDMDSMILAKQNISAVYFKQGKPGLALEEASQSEALAKAERDPLRIAEGSVWKAELLRKLGRGDEAIQHARSALFLAQEHRLWNLSHQAHVILAEVYLARNRDDLAESALKDAISELDQLRGTFQGDFRQKQLFFGKRVRGHHLWVDLLVRNGRAAEALKFAERAKARVLLDLTNRQAAFESSLETAKERNESDQHKRELAALNNLLRQERSKAEPDAMVLKQLQEKRETKRRQFSTSRDLLLAIDPDRSARPVIPRDLGPTSLTQILPNADRAILEFVVTDERVFLFTARRLTSNSPPELLVYPINITRQQLKERVARFHWLLSNRHPSFHEESRALYDLLLKPAEKELRRTKIWCIVPDDIIWDLPFAALEPSDLRYLIEDVALYYAPSLAVHHEMTSRGVPGFDSLLALGNPQAPVEVTPTQKSITEFQPLPEAEIEVQTIAGLFGKSESDVYIGAQASELTFKANARNYSVLHFATHGVLDNLNPLYSYLVLAEGGGEDGLLETHELMDLELNANLVVLSACDTARGQIGVGEGVIGMTWAFLGSGARNTIVSQWPVKSATASRQMISLYRHLKAGLSKAEALRQASLEMLRGKQATHPFYWASFVVIGSNQ